MSGPFGDFFIRDTDREIVLIGGGVGMAPLRAHVFDQLECRKTSRRISFWYGARGRIDLYYADDMERLAREHANFSWHVALSEPAPGDAWDGETGFIHDVVYRKHLKVHPDPAACEYYLCGPPLMIEAVRALLDRLGVPQRTCSVRRFRRLSDDRTQGAPANGRRRDIAEHSARCRTRVRRARSHGPRLRLGVTARAARHERSSPGAIRAGSGRRAHRRPHVPVSSRLRAGPVQCRRVRPSCPGETGCGHPCVARAGRAKATGRSIPRWRRWAGVMASGRSPSRPSARQAGIATCESPGRSWERRLHLAAASPRDMRWTRSCGRSTASISWSSWVARSRPGAAIRRDDPGAWGSNDREPSTAAAYPRSRTDALLPRPATRSRAMSSVRGGMLMSWIRAPGQPVDNGVASVSVLGQRRG